jgi:hypothetical protein
MRPTVWLSRYLCGRRGHEWVIEQVYADPGQLRDYAICRRCGTYTDQPPPQARAQATTDDDSRSA